MSSFFATTITHAAAKVATVAVVCEEPTPVQARQMNTVIGRGADRHGKPTEGREVPLL